MEKNGRVNNVIRIPTSLSGRFFRIWLEYLTPLHKLTNREKDVLAAFLKARFELSNSITDETLLDKVLMSDDIKAKVKAECGVSDAFFQVIIGKLRKIGIITKGKISPIFIPKSLSKDDTSFQFLLYFDLDERNN